LEARVLDFPNAIEKAAPLLGAEGMGDRIVHWAGDVNDTDLGTGQFDLVFMSNLAHHLDQEQNRLLCVRVARALRPGGYFVIQEPVRASSPTEAGQTGTLLGLYFALQSKANVTSWSIADMKSWQLGAGLTPRLPVKLRTAPGWVQQSARLQDRG
jgi:SAM-dependent methyltransferase